MVGIRQDDKRSARRGLLQSLGIGDRYPKVALSLEVQDRFVALAGEFRGIKRKGTDEEPAQRA